MRERERTIMETNRGGSKTTTVDLPSQGGENHSQQHNNEPPTAIYHQLIENSALKCHQSKNTFQVLFVLLLLLTVFYSFVQIAQLRAEVDELKANFENLSPKPRNNEDTTHSINTKVGILVRETKTNGRFYILKL